MDDQPLLSMSAETWVIVPARAGSSGVPGKNSLRINGRSGLERLLNHASAAPSVTLVAVVTNCQWLDREARSLGVPIVDVPPRLFADGGCSTETVKHAAMALALARRRRPTAVIEAYASTPLRPDGCFESLAQAVARGASGALAIEIPADPPGWCVAVDHAGVIDFTVADWRPRELLPARYRISGAGFAASYDALMAGRPDDFRSYFGERVAGVVFERGQTIDLEEPIDVEVAETLLRRQDAAWNRQVSA